MTQPITDYQRKEAFLYLDRLQGGGTVAMNTPYTPTYLCDVFGHDYDTAVGLLKDWLRLRSIQQRSQFGSLEWRVPPRHDEASVAFTFSGKFALFMALIKAMARAEQRHLREARDERTCPECERPVGDSNECQTCSASDHLEAP